MIVYVESNFVLELAFLREEHESCEQVLVLAEADQVELILPAISIVEPYEAVVRRGRSRAKLHDEIEREIRELGRSKPYADVAKISSELTNVLIDSAEEEKKRLSAVIARILECGSIAPIAPEEIRAAIEYENTLSLSLHDALVYASVIGHLRTTRPGPKHFLNRNSRDFLNPDILRELANFECELFTSFENGLGHIQHLLINQRPDAP